MQRNIINLEHVNIEIEIHDNEGRLFTLCLSSEAAIHALINESACVKDVYDRDKITKNINGRCADQFNSQWPIF